MGDSSDKKENRFELREPLRSFLTSIKSYSSADACVFYLVSNKEMDIDEKEDEFKKKFPNGIELNNCDIKVNDTSRYKVLKFIGVDDIKEKNGVKGNLWKFDYKYRPNKYIMLDCINQQPIPGEGITGMTARCKNIFCGDEKWINEHIARKIAHGSTAQDDTARQVHPPCKRLIAIPILDEQKNTLGVIRLDIYDESKEFSEDFKKLTEEKLHSDLHKFINILCRTLVQISNRDAEAKSYKALYKGEKLLEGIKIAEKNCRINDDDVFELLRHLFFVFQRHTYIGFDDIIKRVLYFIEDLCSTTILPYFPIIKKDLEAFRDHENLLLYDIEQYRDHFMHQFHIFVLGYIILNFIGIDKITEQINKKLSRTLKYKDIIISSTNVLRAWVLISFFHDITYIIQEYNTGIREFLGNQLKVDFPIYINWNHILSDRFGYANHLKNLCDIFTSTEEQTLTNQQELLGRYFQSIEFNQDHGVFSSLLLMEQLIPHIENELQIGKINEHDAKLAEVEIYLAALAISIHNPYIFIPLKEGVNPKLSFESFPLEFLLVYCDTAQEWGRKKRINGSVFDGPILKGIDLIESPSSSQKTIICNLKYTTSPPPEDKIKKIVGEKTGSFYSRNHLFLIKYEFEFGGTPLQFSFS